MNLPPKGPSRNGIKITNVAQRRSMASTSQHEWSGLGGVGPRRGSPAGRRIFTRIASSGNLTCMDVKLQTGQVLRNGRYEIQQLLRSARDKDVYLGHDRQLDRQVTVDVFSSNSTMPSGQPLSTWEAQVLARLDDHPNIARVVEYWEENEISIMVSRYFHSKRLEDLISDSEEIGGLSIRRILQLSIEITSGLAHIHRCGILYRDLQPHNVLLDDLDRVRLVDFDTAVFIGDQDMSDLSHRPVIGYMAPELIRGEAIDERSDLYSLGATIYEMCEGHPHFAGTREQILAASRNGPPPLRRDDLPSGLRDLIHRLLAHKRKRRPESAAEVLSRLDHYRTSLANQDRLLATSLSPDHKLLLEAYLKAGSEASAESPSSTYLPDEHRFLMQAIMSLAESEYRLAVIDAGTAAEIALRQALISCLSKRNRTPEYIDQILRNARGLDSLFDHYFRFGAGRDLPISRKQMWDELTHVRNEAAHNGYIPSRMKATQAVECARVLVNAVRPVDGRSQLPRSGGSRS
jgi:serine/threonine protein kinase